MQDVDGTPATGRPVMATVFLIAEKLSFLHFGPPIPRFRHWSPQRVVTIITYPTMISGDDDEKQCHHLSSSRNALVSRVKMEKRIVFFFIDNNFNNLDLRIERVVFGRSRAAVFQFTISSNLLSRAVKKP